jgi:hypothetical protein
MKSNFIGGYWKNRAESLDEVTERIEIFLLELQKIGGIFTTLKRPANIKSEAMNSFFIINAGNIREDLLSRRKKEEVDDNGICKIGFAINLFNELNDVRLTVNCSLGKGSLVLKNNVYVDLKGMTFDKVIEEKIIDLMQSSFQPEYFKVK